MASLLGDERPLAPMLALSTAAPSSSSSAGGLPSTSSSSSRWRSGGRTRLHLGVLALLLVCMLGAAIAWMSYYNTQHTGSPSSNSLMASEADTMVSGVAAPAGAVSLPLRGVRRPSRRTSPATAASSSSSLVDPSAYTPLPRAADPNEDPVQRLRNTPVERRAPVGQPPFMSLRGPSLHLPPASAHPQPAPAAAVAAAAADSATPMSAAGRRLLRSVRTEQQPLEAGRPVARVAVHDEDDASAAAASSSSSTGSLVPTTTVIDGVDLSSYITDDEDTTTTTTSSTFGLPMTAQIINELAPSTITR